MQSPNKILSDLWTLAGGELSALEAAVLTGEEPQLPSAFRAAAHQFQTSPRRRLQAPELQAGTRRCSGRADAVGRRGIRERGLCRGLRGRADALARRMVGAASCQSAGCAAADLDRKNR